MLDLDKIFKLIFALSAMKKKKFTKVDVQGPVL
jgi:hypothetical protein